MGLIYDRIKYIRIFEYYGAQLKKEMENVAGWLAHLNNFQPSEIALMDIDTMYMWLNQAEKIHTKLNNATAKR